MIYIDCSDLIIFLSGQLFNFNIESLFWIDLFAFDSWVFPFLCYPVLIQPNYLVTVEMMTNWNKQQHTNKPRFHAQSHLGFSFKNSEIFSDGFRHYYGCWWPLPTPGDIAQLPRCLANLDPALKESFCCQKWTFYENEEKKFCDFVICCNHWLMFIAV